MKTSAHLETERLNLKPLHESDSDFIQELVNTAGWITFIGNRNIHSNADALAYIQKINANPTVTYWTVETKESKTTIGIVTLIKRDYLEHNDIGFAFLPTVAKNGFAFEAVQKVIENLLQKPENQTLFAITIPENSHSIRLLEKLNFHFDRTIAVDNENLNIFKKT